MTFSEYWMPAFYDEDHEDVVFSEYWMPAFYDEDHEDVDSYIRLFVEAACSFVGILPVPIAAERVVNPNAFPMAAEREGSGHS